VKKLVEVASVMIDDDAKMFVTNRLANLDSRVPNEYVLSSVGVMSCAVVVPVTVRLVIVVVARVEVPVTVRVPDAVMLPPTDESPVIVEVPTYRLSVVIPVAEAVDRVV
jgi:hypothetical protein